MYYHYHLLDDGDGDGDEDNSKVATMNAARSWELLWSFKRLNLTGLHAQAQQALDNSSCLHTNRFLAPNLIANFETSTVNSEAS